MRRIIILLTFSLILTSCRKEPDMSHMDRKCFTYTNYDRSANFMEYDTFFIPDSILIIGSDASPVYAKSRTAQNIINTFAHEMNKCGYERVYEMENADLGLQISYIEQTYYFLNYADSIWWWGYPEYWSPVYWGDWGYWRYTYPITFTYSIDSILTEMIDLTSQRGADNALSVIWDCFVQNPQEQYIPKVKALTDGITQAFNQSPYLGK